MSSDEVDIYVSNNEYASSKTITQERVINNNKRGSENKAHKNMNTIDEASKARQRINRQTNQGRRANEHNVRATDGGKGQRRD